MTFRMRVGAKAYATSAALAIAALTMTSCGSGGGAASASGGGEGVPAGATKEEYIAAFEEVDEIELYAQSPAPQGAPGGQAIETYLEAIEEWSGGKITVDIAFSNAVAADATEVDDALNDGRLDVAQVLPMYEPSDYPATNALVSAGILNNTSPVVGVMQSNAWVNEVAFNTAEIMEEWEQHGLVPLMPFYAGGATGLYCADERNSSDELQGATVATGTDAMSRQIEALGGSGTSIAYTEFFESVQRGVIDCILSVPAGSALGGFIPEAPNVVIDSDAAFATNPGGLAFSKSKWDELPLVAQQLLRDRVDVYFEANLTSRAWPELEVVSTQVAESNGAFIELEDTAQAALLEANESILQDLRSNEALDGETFVDEATTSAEQWTTRVEELGYKNETDYAGFAEWWAKGEPDVSPFVDEVMTEVFESQRPE